MKAILGISLLAGILALNSCLENRDYPRPAAVPPTDTVLPPAGDSIAVGSLLISEFIAKGCSSPATSACMPANYTPTVSYNGKWFELYNPTTKDIKMEPGQWSFTDSLPNPSKWVVTDSGFVVPAKGYAYVCTDNLNTSEIVNGRVVFHTDFSLSSDGGQIGVFYTKVPDTGTPLQIDGLSYPADVAGYDSNVRHKSYGRIGGTAALPLTPMSAPTPGAPNQP